MERERKRERERVREMERDAGRGHIVLFCAPGADKGGFDRNQFVAEIKCASLMCLCERIICDDLRICGLELVQDKLMNAFLNFIFL